MFGDLISAGAKLIGGFFDRQDNAAARAAQEQANMRSEALSRELNALALADKEKDRAMQREFAQQGIRWKVDDALAAGIHPIYGLGGSGAAYSPSSISLVSPEVSSTHQRSSMGSTLASMGQDIGRAVNATRTQDERNLAYTQALQEKTLRRADLENDLLASKLKRLQVQANPAMPRGDAVPPPEADIPEEGPSNRKQIKIGGTYFPADPQTSTGQDLEDTLGDEGIPAYLIKNIAQMFHVWHGGSTAANQWARNQSARAEGRYKRYTGSRFVPKRYRD